MENIDNELSKILSWTFTNKNIKYLLVGLGIFLILMKKIPPNNIIYNIIILFFILYFSNHDIQLTVILVIILIMTLNKNNIEKFSDTDYANYTRTLSQTCTHANDCVYPLDYRSNYNCFSDCKKTCLGE